MKKHLWLTYVFLILLAFSFRLFIAFRLATDEPEDGRIYSQIARNVLEHRIYSHDTQPPYTPSIIRLPGFPLFLAGVYKVFGVGNDKAVRLIQAVLDTATCILIALVALQWAIKKERKHRAALLALALAAICPFTSIYVATILTEVSTNLLAVAMVLTATLAFKSQSRRKELIWWAVTGLIAGLAVLFRPDSGLFAAAIGATLILSSLIGAQRFLRLRRAIISASLFAVAFGLVLVPWTIRNQRVFHLFQPLAPAHAEMPGEFVPRGYLLWVRTWLDDSRYVAPVLWALDTKPIRISDFPDRAFDSKEERDRVAALLDKYNHPDDEDASSEASDEDEDQDSESVQSTEPWPPEEINVEMTPPLDAGFAQIGQERVAHSLLRYYIVLPLKRAKTLWFDTHSDYYPFNGELLPLEDLDRDTHQQYWLPLFTALMWIYTLLGLIGGCVLWWSRDRNARRWLLLAALLIFLRLGFLATLENPEPRYTVELFPFLIAVGSAVVGAI